MRADAYNPWAVATVTPALPFLAEEIESVPVELVQSKRPGNARKLVDKIVESLAHQRHGYTS
jgi:hypothetical protein